MRSNDREHLGMLMQSHRWELIATARRQVSIPRHDAEDVVQQLCLDVLEGRHPPLDDRQEMLIWLRIEVIERCMQLQQTRGRDPELLPPAVDEPVRSAVRGDRRAIRHIFLIYTHLVLADIERDVLEGCPGWREGSVLEELHRALRGRRLPDPPADRDAEQWLVEVMFDLAQRRRARLTARAARATSEEAA